MTSGTSGSYFIEKPHAREIEAEIHPSNCQNHSPTTNNPKPETRNYNSKQETKIRLLNSILFILLLFYDFADLFQFDFHRILGFGIVIELLQQFYPFQLIFFDCLH